ncbi:MAG TPA: histidine phosphatase family protein [Acidimicrobiales bacterium]|nr:histidine phosphatase family protein [Acidimicrobiales bacterium]
MRVLVATMDARTTRLLLLRHGEVASHRGDVPVTAEGLRHAEDVGRALRPQVGERARVLFGGTRRTRETAEAIVRGLGEEATIDGPFDSFALRNPDLYLAGVRVDMVSSPETLAVQVPEMEVDDVRRHGWWMAFFEAPDRIGSWLTHPAPCGEDAGDVARRVHRFARSLAGHGPTRGATVIGVTHSPVLRSVLSDAAGADPGEPAYVTGVEVRIDAAGEVSVTPFDALAPTDHPRADHPRADHR